MDKKHRFGIIGCGFVGELHANAIKVIDSAELVAACNINMDKAVAFARKYDVKKVYTDYRQLIDDDEVDIVCICTPSGNHAEAAIYAAEAGKHIFCDKPIAVTKEENDAIVDAVRKSGVKMQNVFQRRTYPLYMAIKIAIEQGRFGRIVQADAFLKYHRSQAYYDTANWKGTWTLGGGGALMNQGVHGIDMLLWMVGDVEGIFGRTATMVRKIEVEDTAAAVLKYKNGAFGLIECATSVLPGHEETRFEILGEKGFVVFGEKSLSEPMIFECKMEDSPDAKSPAIEIPDYLTRYSWSEYIKIGHKPLMQNLIEAIEEDTQLILPPEVARKAVDIVLGIYESSRTGKEIKI